MEVVDATHDNLAAVGGHDWQVLPKVMLESLPHEFGNSVDG